MFINSQKLLGLLEQLAPKKYAESWDNVGLLLGNDEVEIDKVMVTLDVTEVVVDEAIEKNVDLIISHHPVIFKGMKNITDRTYQGRLIRKLIKNDIHVYSAHTNLDIAKGGLNDYLMNLIGLDDLSLLTVSDSLAFYKLITFVPTDSSEMVKNALFKAGAGRLGDYDECSYQTVGSGNFRPNEGANPAIGEIGSRESVEEVKIETIVPEKDLDRCLRALIKAHPYETLAYDVFKMENLSEPYGLGRTGKYAEPIAGEAFLKQVKEVLGAEILKVAGKVPEQVKKVGLCTGAGSEFIHAAKRKGCDVFITGDVKYHEAQLAEQLDVCIVDAGHFETENIYMSYLQEYLEEKCIDKNYEVRIIKSESLENPFKVY